MSNELICTETLVASLRDPAVEASGAIRYIYVTAKPMGSEGATGIVKTGDLGADLTAKIITFDREHDAFIVTRNGNPPIPTEFVPDGDIGALLRSFVRAQVQTAPPWVTVTDMLPEKQIETVRKALSAEQIELQCTHGPDPSARGVPYASHIDTAISGQTILVCIGLAITALFIYNRYFKKTPPPDRPNLQPYYLEQKYGAKKLEVPPHLESSVRSALDKWTPPAP